MFMGGRGAIAGISERLVVLLVFPLQSARSR